MKDKKEASEDKPDFYIENGLYVFTADYHIKRRQCCGNGCRHCPYEPKNKKGSTKVNAAFLH